MKDDVWGLNDTEHISTAQHLLKIGNAQLELIVLV